MEEREDMDIGKCGTTCRARLSHLVMDWGDFCFARAPKARF